MPATARKQQRGKARVAQLPKEPFERVYLNVIGEGEGAIQADIPRLIQHLRHFPVDEFSGVTRSANFREVGAVHFRLYLPGVGHTFNATTNKPDLIALLRTHIAENRKRYKVTPRVPDYEPEAS